MKLSTLAAGLAACTLAISAYALSAHAQANDSGWSVITPTGATYVTSSTSPQYTQVTQTEVTFPANPYPAHGAWPVVGFGGALMFNFFDGDLRARGDV